MRFEVLLNGKSLCIAGIDEGGASVNVLSMWPRREWGRDPQADVVEKLRQLYVEDAPELSVHGVEGGDQPDRMLWTWIEQRVQAGDEIKIRMLGPGPVTPPTDRKPIGTYQKQKASAGFGTP